MSKTLTEYERKVKRDAALKPLQRCETWVEAEVLRGNAVGELRFRKGRALSLWQQICRFAENPTDASETSAIFRGRLFADHEKQERAAELAQRRIDHYAAEGRRLRSQPWGAP